MSMVAELLSENGQWNEDFIKQSFIPVDAAAILRTPARIQYGDVWAWEPERHGVYFVTSAYRLLDMARIRDDVVPAASVSENSVWRKIWKLKVLPKIRVFWWRVVHEFLPTRQILHRKHVEPIANCEMCGAETESIRHVLLECSIAKAFWEQTKIATGVKLPTLHQETWAQVLVEGRAGSERDQTTIIIGRNALWMQRNRRRHGEMLPPIRVAVQWAADLAFDLRQATHSQSSVTEPRAVPRWERPPLGWIKCNTDGVFYEQTGQGATGAVLRDGAGAFIRGSAKWYDHCLDALTLEAIACRDGLALSVQSGVRKIWLETDCQQMVQLWQAGTNQRSTISTILQEIRELSLLFHDFKLSFVSRDCNKVAHVLAKQVTGDTRAGWWTYAPAYVLDLLSSYCNPAPPDE